MKITVPTELKDITLEQFIKYNRIINLPEIDEISLEIGMVAVFCNLSIKEAGLIPRKDFKEISERILKTLDQQPKFHQIYDGFGFIPNLDEITADEYIDLDRYAGEYEMYHRFMAVCYRPITKQKGDDYSIEEYNGTETHCAKMLSMPVELFLGVQVFFYNLKKDLLKAMMVYLQKLPQQEAQALGQTLSPSGVGIPHLIQSLRGAELQLNKLAS